MTDGAPGCLLAEKEKEKDIKQGVNHGKLFVHGMIGYQQTKKGVTTWNNHK